MFLLVCQPYNYVDHYEEKHPEDNPNDFILKFSQYNLLLVWSPPSRLSITVPFLGQLHGFPAMETSDYLLRSRRPLRLP